MGRQHQNLNPKMDEHSCKQNRTKSCECAGIHNHRKEVTPKRKNWSAPGITGVQYFWWKKFRGTWSAILRCFNQSLELPDEIPDWLTHGRTVLLPKTEDLSNERNYRPITFLNTCYNIFTGMICNYMKEHAERKKHLRQKPTGNVPSEPSHNEQSKKPTKKFSSRQ